MLEGADDHLTQLLPVILNSESTGLTHLESEIRVTFNAHKQNIQLTIERTHIYIYICVMEYKTSWVLIECSAELSS